MIVIYSLTIIVQVIEKTTNTRAYYMYISVPL